MSKEAQAELILRLYELRREPVMREARDWFVREFNPQSFEDFKATMFGPHTGHLRMVMSYWEMAAALVNHGAISVKLFDKTNGEHYGVYAKVEPFIAETRAALGPQFLASLEKLIKASPNGPKRVKEIRERMKGILAELAKQRAAQGAR